MSKSRLVNAYVFGIVLAMAVHGLPGSAAALSGVQLGPNELVVVNGARCGLVQGKWVPGSVLRSGRFYTFSQQIKDTRKKQKKKGLSGSAKSKLKAKISKLSKKLKLQKRLCNSVPGLLTPTPTPTSIATPIPGSQVLPWNVDATAVKDDFGGEYLYFCPPNPSQGLDSIWGTDFYTTDSAICVAGVHAGLFNRGSGGNVKIRIKTGSSLYIGSLRHGVDSSFYGPFSSAFVFLSLSTGQEVTSSGPQPIRWTQDAAPIYSLIDQSFAFRCPAGGSADGIWGTNIYTYDSSICTAAVHAGLISFQNGGNVTIVLKPGQGSYLGSTRHGVTSQSYGAWSGSFIFQ
jgi:hypothetical protein